MVAEPPVFVVADGMGGYDAGEVASALATNRCQGNWGQSNKPPHATGGRETKQGQVTPFPPT